MRSVQTLDSFSHVRKEVLSVNESDRKDLETRSYTLQRVAGAVHADASSQRVCEDGPTLAELDFAVRLLLTVCQAFALQVKSMEAPSATIEHLGPPEAMWKVITQEVENSRTRWESQYEALLRAVQDHDSEEEAPPEDELTGDVVLLKRKIVYFFSKSKPILAVWIEALAIQSLGQQLQRSKDIVVEFKIDDVVKQSTADDITIDTLKTITFTSLSTEDLARFRSHWNSLHKSVLAVFEHRCGLGH